QEEKFNLNGSLITTEELEHYISELDGFLVTEFIVQGSFATSLYSNTTNTIRLMMLRDPDNGEMFSCMAVQRIGSKSSEPVDNFSGGGMLSLVNLSTGELSSAVSSPAPAVLKWHDTHPDTGAPIKGAVIPG